MGFQWLEKVVELDNIAPLLSRERLDGIASTVIEGHAQDKQSRTEWESRQGEYMKLALQVMETKNTPWPNCYSLDTDVLTSTGWQPIGDVNKGDLVYSRNKNGLAGYYTVTDTFYGKADKMVYFKGKSIDLLVTLNHKMLLENKNGEQSFRTAAECLWTKDVGYIPLTSHWLGRKRFTIYDIPAKAYVRFLGWYISEGWAYKPKNKNKQTTGSFGIVQSLSANPDNYKTIQKDIEACGFTYSKHDRGFIIHARSMSDAVKQELRSLGINFQKFIPDYILQLPRDLLNELLDTLILGDGCSREREGKQESSSYYTTSKRLADNVQELIQKIGLRGTVSLRMACAGGVINGRSIQGSLTGYSIQINNKTRIQTQKLDREIVLFDGHVACVETTLHTLYVRRNGKAVWCGNSANVKYPLLTTATMQFGARAYPGIIGSANVAKGKVTGFDPDGEKAKSAQRIGLHMSYQLLDEMDEWEDDMDQLCLSLPIVGCMFKKTYFSPAKNRNVSELVFPQYLVVNYWTRRLSSAPRLTHEIHLQDNDVVERINSGLFTDQDYAKEYPEELIITNEIHGIHSPQGNETSPNLFLEQHLWLDLDDDGYKEPYIVTVGGGSVARIVAGFDLDKVKVKGSKIVSIARTEYFTKYGFVPNPDGSFYDIGFGLLLGPINHTINTTLNQLLDAGTLSNRSAGFLGRGARLKGGEHSFNPFEWKQVLSTGDDLRKSIVPLPVREPSGVLFNLLGLMIESGKELSNTVPMLLGQNPGQNQPATTSMAVIDQGLKVYSSILKRLHRALKSELKKLKRLNGIYLPDKSYFQILDPQLSEGQDPSQIFRRDYQDDVTAVIPYSDPAIVSEVQRMIKAQQLSEMIQQGLIPNRAAAAKIVLEAMDLPNIDELLTPPEPQPDPEQELKRAQADHQAKIDFARLELEHDRLALDKKRVGIQEIKDETVGMLNLAKAEAQEIGTQRDEYKADIESMERERDRELERDKMKAANNGGN